MPRKTWILRLASLAFTSLIASRTLADFPPQKLALLPEDDSVYAPPRPMREDEGVNQGGAHIDLNVNYMTAHFYRGINYNQVNDKKDAPNLQFDAKLEFDLGKLPHPFIGVFANVYDSDPISRFQEIRPVVGLEWKVRPFIAAVGHNSYIYPEREKFDTSEVWAQRHLRRLDHLPHRPADPLPVRLRGLRLRFQ